MKLTVYPEPHELQEHEQRRGRRMIVAGSLVAMLTLSGMNPELLSLLALRLDPGTGNALLACFFLLPFMRVLTALGGPLADRLGKKIILVPTWTPLPFVIFLMAWLTGAGALVDPDVIVLGLLGLLLLVSALQSWGLAGWFPLINDNVPANIRGRFFGMLRTCWQLALFVLSLLVGRFLGDAPQAWKFQVLVVVAGVAVGARTLMFTAIPEAPVRKDADGHSTLRRLAGAVDHEMLSRFGLTPNRFVFAVRTGLSVIPLLMLPFLSRRHGGHVQVAMTEFPGVALARLRSFCRWRY